MPEFYPIVPDPQRITDSMRDTGYELDTAVADLVDNSIAAMASEVRVEFILDMKGRVRFSIADNGEGMNPEGIVDALRYGSKRRDDPASLGRFGLGLKTASTAFAKAVMLTSKSESDSVASSFSLDLDVIGEQGWVVTKFDTEDLHDGSMIQGKSGTVLRWEKIDRVLPIYKDATGSAAKNKIEKIVLDLRLHLSMTFQRFLDDGDIRAPNVRLYLNDTEVEAWDPFAWSATTLVEQIIEVETPEGEIREITLRAFCLPRKADMKAEFGPTGDSLSRLTNEKQGVYVYRQNRLIHGPDWLGMFAQEPHFTLIRVELSFEHQLDEAFQVDIKKSRILIEPLVEAAIKKVLSGPRRAAQNRYREGGQSPAAIAADRSAHLASNAVIKGVSPEVSTSKLESFSGEKGEAIIENKQGRVSVKYSETGSTSVFLETVDELKYNVLYEPSWIGSNPGVLINRSHPFYNKVYIPNLKSGVTVQSLDSLLWALANAEFDHTQESTRRMFEDMRISISKTLERLVEDLADPEMGD